MKRIYRTKVQHFVLTSAAAMALAAVVLAQQPSPVDNALRDLAAQDLSTRGRGLYALLAQSGGHARGGDVHGANAPRVTVIDLLHNHPKEAERIKTSFIAALEQMGAESQRLIGEPEALTETREPIEDWLYLGPTTAGTYLTSGGGGPPVISNLSPPSAVYGESGYLEMDGTNFDPNGCYCVAGVWANNYSFGTVEWASDTVVTVYYSDTPPVGQNQIQIETQTGVDSNQMPFTINGDPTPSITGVSPQSPWQPGAVYQNFSLSGSGFGSTGTATDVNFSCGGGPCVDNFTLGGWSDTSITGTVTVDANAGGQTVTIAVLSTGYDGNGFQAGQGQSNQGTAQVQVTGCTTPVLYVTYTVNNGSPVQINPGDTIWVTPDPYMPAISALVVPNPPCTISGTVTYQILTSYNGGGYTYPSSPASLPVNQTFTVPGSPFYGGQAAINWTYNGANEGPFTFQILGQNPYQSTVEAALVGWAINIGTHESGLQEFGSTSIPFQDSAGGFGVMQLTSPAPTEDQKWNWQSNIAAGQALLGTDMGNGASAFFSRLAAWTTWNQQNPGQQVPAAPDWWEGDCCVFSMQGTPGSYTYPVAIGLKRYAGAPLPWGDFLYWNTSVTPPAWVVSPDNGVRPDVVYEFCSCSDLSTCQHSGQGHSLGN